MTRTFYETTCFAGSKRQEESQNIVPISNTTLPRPQTARNSNPHPNKSDPQHDATKPSETIDVPIHPW